MILQMTVIGLVVMALCAFAAESPSAPGEQPAGMSQEAMELVQAMKAAHENSTAPSAFHQKLEHFVGDWEVTLRMWMAGPDAPPAESVGEVHIEWILDGRFITERMQAELPMGGMKIPLDSFSVTGYDNYRNLYVGSLFGSLSTEIINTQGSVSLDGKTFTAYGRMHEPNLNVASRMVRFETKIEDEDHHVVTVYDLHAGEDYVALQFAYARK